MSQVTGHTHSQSWNRRVASAARLNGFDRVGVAEEHHVTTGYPRGKSRMCCHSGVSGGSVLARVRGLRRVVSG